MIPTLPRTPFSVALVSCLSVGSMVYTMWPWIQEQEALKREKSRIEFEELQKRDPAAAQAILDNARKNETFFHRIAREKKEKEIRTAQEMDEYWDARAKYGLETRDFSQYMYEIPKDIDPSAIQIATLDDIEKSKIKDEKLKQAQSFVSDQMYGGKFVLYQNEKDRPHITYSNFYAFPTSIDTAEFDALPSLDDHDHQQRAGSQLDSHPAVRRMSRRPQSSLHSRIKQSFRSPRHPIVKPSPTGQALGGPANDGAETPLGVDPIPIAHTIASSPHESPSKPISPPYSSHHDLTLITPGAATPSVVNQTPVRSGSTIHSAQSISHIAPLSSPSSTNTDVVLNISTAAAAASQIPIDPDAAECDRISRIVSAETLSVVFEYMGFESIADIAQTIPYWFDVLFEQNSLWVNWLYQRFGHQIVSRGTGIIDNRDFLQFQHELLRHVDDPQYLKKYRRVNTNSNSSSVDGSNSDEDDDEDDDDSSNSLRDTMSSDQFYSLSPSGSPNILPIPSEISADHDWLDLQGSMPSQHQPGTLYKQPQQRHPQQQQPQGNVPISSSVRFTSNQAKVGGVGGGAGSGPFASPPDAPRRPGSSSSKYHSISTPLSTGSRQRRQIGDDNLHGGPHHEGVLPPPNEFEMSSQLQQVLFYHKRYQFHITATACINKQRALTLRSAIKILQKEYSKVVHDNCMCQKHQKMRETGEHDSDNDDNDDDTLASWKQNGRHGGENDDTDTDEIRDNLDIYNDSDEDTDNGEDNADEDDDDNDEDGDNEVEEGILEDSGISSSSLMQSGDDGFQSEEDKDDEYSNDHHDQHHDKSSMLHLVATTRGEQLPSGLLNITSSETSTSTSTSPPTSSPSNADDIVRLQAISGAATTPTSFHPSLQHSNSNPTSNITATTTTTTTTTTDSSIPSSFLRSLCTLDAPLLQRPINLQQPNLQGTVQSEASYAMSHVYKLMNETINTSTGNSRITPVNAAFQTWSYRNRSRIRNQNHGMRFEGSMKSFLYLDAFLRRKFMSINDNYSITSEKLNKLSHISVLFSYLIAVIYTIECMIPFPCKYHQVYDDVCDGGDDSDDDDDDDGDDDDDDNDDAENILLGDINASLTMSHDELSLDGGHPLSQLSSSSSRGSDVLSLPVSDIPSFHQDEKPVDSHFSSSNQRRGSSPLVALQVSNSEALGLHRGDDGSGSDGGDDGGLDGNRDDEYVARSVAQSWMDECQFNFEQFMDDDDLLLLIRNHHHQRLTESIHEHSSHGVQTTLNNQPFCPLTYTPSAEAYPSLLLHIYTSQLWHDCHFNPQNYALKPTVSALPRYTKPMYRREYRNIRLSSSQMDEIKQQVVRPGQLPTSIPSPQRSPYGYTPIYSTDHQTTQQHDQPFSDSLSTSPLPSSARSPDDSDVSDFTARRTRQQQREDFAHMLRLHIAMQQGLGHSTSSDSGTSSSSHKQPGRVSSGAGMSVLKFQSREPVTSLVLRPLALGKQAQTAVDHTSSYQRTHMAHMAVHSPRSPVLGPHPHSPAALPARFTYPEQTKQPSSAVRGTPLLTSREIEPGYVASPASYHSIEGGGGTGLPTTGSSASAEFDGVVFTAGNRLVITTAIPNVTHYLHQLASSSSEMTSGFDGKPPAPRKGKGAGLAMSPTIGAQHQQRVFSPGNNSGVLGPNSPLPARSRGGGGGPQMTPLSLSRRDTTIGPSSRGTPALTGHESDIVPPLDLPPAIQSHTDGNQVSSISGGDQQSSFPSPRDQQQQHPTQRYVYHNNFGYDRQVLTSKTELTSATSMSPSHMLLVEGCNLRVLDITNESVCFTASKRDRHQDLISWTGLLNTTPASQRRMYYYAQQQQILADIMEQERAQHASSVRGKAKGKRGGGSKKRLKNRRFYDDDDDHDDYDSAYNDPYGNDPATGFGRGGKAYYYYDDLSTKAATSGVTQILPGVQASLNHLLFLQDIACNKIVSTSLDGTIKIWDLETSTCVNTLSGDSIPQYEAQYEGTVSGGMLSYYYSSNYAYTHDTWRFNRRPRAYITTIYSAKQWDDSAHPSRSGGGGNSSRIRLQRRLQSQQRRLPRSLSSSSLSSQFTTAKGQQSPGSRRRRFSSSSASGLPFMLPPQSHSPSSRSPHRAYQSPQYHQRRKQQLSSQSSSHVLMNPHIAGHKPRYPLSLIEPFPFSVSSPNRYIYSHLGYLFLTGTTINSMIRLNKHHRYLHYYKKYLDAHASQPLVFSSETQRAQEEQRLANPQEYYSTRMQHGTQNQIKTNLGQLTAGALITNDILVTGSCIPDPYNDNEVLDAHGNPSSSSSSAASSSSISSAKGSVGLWDLRFTKSCLHVFNHDSSQPVTSMNVTTNGGSAAVSDQRNSGHMNTATASLAQHERDNIGFVTSLATNHDFTVYAGHHSGLINVYDIRRFDRQVTSIDLRTTTNWSHKKGSFSKYTPSSSSSPLTDTDGGIASPVHRDRRQYPFHRNINTSCWSSTRNIYPFYSDSSQPCSSFASLSQSPPASSSSFDQPTAVPPPMSRRPGDFTWSYGSDTLSKTLDQQLSGSIERSTERTRLGRLLQSSMDSSIAGGVGGGVGATPTSPFGSTAASMFSLASTSASKSKPTLLQYVFEHSARQTGGGQHMYDPSTTIYRHMEQIYSSKHYSMFSSMFDIYDVSKESHGGGAGVMDIMSTPAVTIGAQQPRSAHDDNILALLASIGPATAASHLTPYDYDASNLQQYQYISPYACYYTPQDIRNDPIAFNECIMLQQQCYQLYNLSIHLDTIMSCVGIISASYFTTELSNILDILYHIIKEYVTHHVFASIQTSRSSSQQQQQQQSPQGRSTFERFDRLLRRQERQDRLDRLYTAEGLPADGIDNALWADRDDFSLDSDDDDSYDDENDDDDDFDIMTEWDAHLHQDQQEYTDSNSSGIRLSALDRELAHPRNQTSSATAGHSSIVSLHYDSTTQTLFTLQPTAISIFSVDHSYIINIAQYNAKFFRDLYRGSFSSYGDVGLDHHEDFFHCIDYSSATNTLVCSLGRSIYVLKDVLKPV